MTYDRADDPVISLAVSTRFTASPSRIGLRFDIVGGSVCRAHEACGLDVDSGF